VLRILFPGRPNRQEAITLVTSERPLFSISTLNFTTFQR